MMKLKLYIKISAISIFLAGCLSEEHINLPYDDYQPQQLNDGWQISDPQSEGLDAATIESVYQQLFNEDLYPTVHSMLIIRNGKLVAEAYSKDKKERDIPHNLVSATKSITSLLAGIAMDKGYIDALSSTVYNYIPQYFDDDLRKRSITLHDVLTMETGLDFDNDVHTNEMYNYSGSSLEFVLHKKLLFLPGESWYYGDGNPQLISGIIDKVSGQSEEDFAAEHLFNPLAISNYRWEKHNDGLNYGAKGLWLKPRDMAKIGQLMLQQGQWQGMQVVSSEWVELSTRLQSTHQNYGYYWYPEATLNAFYAEGHGGQLIWIAPDAQLVLVFTADPYAKSYMLSDSYAPLITDIISAIKE